MKEAPDLKLRTKTFALRVVRLYSALPKNAVAQILGKQILRAGTAVGAHYRVAQRAKSHADFTDKIEGALQELEETIYWLELICDSEIFPSERVKPLMAEADELLAILVSKLKGIKNQPKSRS